MDSLHRTTLYRSEVTKEVSGMIIVQEGDLLEMIGKPQPDGKTAFKSVKDSKASPTVYLGPGEFLQLTEDYSDDEFDQPETLS